MFIDTVAANRGTRIQVRTSPPSAGPSSRGTTPLLDSFLGQGPPPSYLEATTPNLWDARRRSEDEAARLLSFDGRVSLVSPLVDPPDGMYKNPTYRKRNFRERCSRAPMLILIPAIVLTILLIAAISVVATHGDMKSNIATVPAQSEESAPHVPPQQQKDYPIHWPSRCGKDYNVKTEEHSFESPPELRIQEGVSQMGGGFKRASGWIHVVQAPADQKPGTIRAEFSYATSSSIDINSINYVASESGLTIGDSPLSGLTNGDRHGSACIGMSVVLYMAPGTRLENFNVQATHLGMQVHEGADFSVTNATSISLRSGTLDASSFGSRETRLETIAGTISGKYVLSDLLYVNTISGSVNINIEPMERTDEESPAIFQAQSVSGSIRTDYERKSIPKRDYQVFVDTKVGSIDGTFIHGSKTTLQSIAGSINADILPFQPGDYASRIETDSRSGGTRVNVQAPHRNPGTVMGKLTSTHKSISGAIDLTYPPEWEGHINGSALNGALHLQGKNLELIDETIHPGKNHAEAKKGNGHSELSFTTVNGGCEVKVGKL